MSTQAKRRVLLSRVEIEATIHRLASEITRDYINKNPVLIGILKASFMFMADLVRLLDFSLEIDFVRTSSYGKNSQSSGKIKIVQALRSSIGDWCLFPCAAATAPGWIPWQWGA